MRTFLFALALAVPLDAFAARNEISFEYVGDFHGDDGVDMATGTWVANAVGLRGGGAIFQDRRHFGLVLDGGWTRSFQAAHTNGYFYDPASGGNTELPGYTSALDIETLTVGLKGDYEVRNIFYPYVHAQLGVAIGSLSVDDDHTRPDNLNQLTSVGAAPVGLFGLGAEIMLPDLAKGWKVTGAIFFEGGYEVAGNMRLGDAGGPINLSGGLFRTGIGLRFR
jgi:hypothetical protein